MSLSQSIQQTGISSIQDTKSNNVVIQPRRKSLTSSNKFTNINNNNTNINKSHSRNSIRNNNNITGGKRPSKRLNSKEGLLEDSFSAFDEEFSKSDFVRSSQRRGDVSLTHLLNFNFPPRLNNQIYRKKTEWNSSNYHNKERFVNANYRFVVSDENADYSFNLIDPDLAVDWDKVLQVIMPTSAIITCPICLHPPTAAKVTKCGHVYCWHCLSHYLSLENLHDKTIKKWKKCPICYDAVESTHLRSVRIISTKDYKNPKNNIYVNEKNGVALNLKMSLMKRLSGSTTALPKNTYNSWVFAKSISESSSQSIPPTVRDVNALTFSKLLLCSNEYLREEILMREKSELEQVLSEITVSVLNKTLISFTSEDKKFIDVCLDLTNSKLTELNSKITEKGDCDMSNNYCSSSSDLQVKENITVPNESIVKKNSVDSNVKLSEKKSTDYYYFYQSSDGQNLYLHPLDIKILLHEYGEYSKFPDKIDVDIIHLSESTLDEDLRKKFKYLGHIPLGCDIEEISKRKKKHIEKERKEENLLKKNNFRNDLVAKQVEIEELENFFTSQRVTGEGEDLKSYGDSEELFPPIGLASTSPEAQGWSGPSFARIAGNSTVKKTVERPYHQSGTRFRVLYNESSFLDDEKEDGDTSWEEKLNPLFKKEWTLDIGDIEEKKELELVNTYLSLEKGKDEMNVKIGKNKKKKGVTLVSNSGPTRRRY
ncbi:RING finger protein 10 [Clydaea vesicula]|uniref:RING finger protein 10 n=1 Tax=Clydaea vesicula TaxID=447962 RepID=A0AAD5U6I9_9FUNG|nr:RING finger protein 10 [Clydaea vesicula]